MVCGGVAVDLAHSAENGILMCEGSAGETALMILTEVCSCHYMLHHLGGNHSPLSC